MRRLTLEQFIEKARATHGDKYDYSRVVFNGTKAKVTIGCLSHGWFEQVAETHLYNKSGCPVCSDGGTNEERFWRYVNKKGSSQPHMESTCWEWTGSLHSKGYGQFRDGKMVKAHVFSYELHYGPIPMDGSAFGRLFVLHKCDNPACVRPSHLFLGTHDDNMKDMVRKGRSADASGENAGNSKLTWGEVREIRNRYQFGSWTYETLGNEFGVNPATISCIIRGMTWKE